MIERLWQGAAIVVVGKTDLDDLEKRLEAAESIRQHSRLLFVAKRVLIGALDRGDLLVAVEEHEALLAAALAGKE